MQEGKKWTSFCCSSSLTGLQKTSSEAQEKENPNDLDLSPEVRFGSNYRQRFYCLWIVMWIYSTKCKENNVSKCCVELFHVCSKVCTEVFQQIVLIQFTMLLTQVACLASLLLIITAVAKVSRMQHSAYVLADPTWLPSATAPGLKRTIEKNVLTGIETSLSKSQDLLVLVAWKATLSAVCTQRRKNTDDARALCATYWLIIHICFLICYLSLPPSILHWPVSEPGHWMRRVQKKFRSSLNMDIFKHALSKTVRWVLTSYG